MNFLLKGGVVGGESSPESKGRQDCEGFGARREREDLGVEKRANGVKEDEWRCLWV